MRHKLLLADDSVTIQRVVELTFSGEDVQVVTVGDGEQAIARIPVERPDIVLADIGMPKRSGYEVAEFVKGRPDLSHIPVLLLAGAFEPVDESRAEEVHSDGVLVKPFEPQQVIARVRALIRDAEGSAGKAAAPAEEPPAWAGVAPREVQEAAAPATDVAGARDRSVEPRLDDYFERLDAAFAQLSANGAPSSPRQQTDDEIDGRDVPTLEGLLGSSATTANEPHAGHTPVPTEPGRYAPASDAAVTASASTTRVDALSDGRNIVADMFAALFAVEQGEPMPAPPPLAAVAPLPQPPAVSESLVDEVTRRVIERLAPEAANELVTRVVTDIAERLVREEIARIKSAVATRY